MAISTNQKPMIYRNLYENTGPGPYVCSEPIKRPIIHQCLYVSRVCEKWNLERTSFINVMLLVQAIAFLISGKLSRDVATSLGRSIRWMQKWNKRHVHFVRLDDKPRSGRPSVIKCQEVKMSSGRQNTPFSHSTCMMAYKRPKIPQLAEVKQGKKSFESFKSWEFSSSKIHTALQSRHTRQCSG